MSELIQLFFKGKWRQLFLAPTNNGWIQLFRYGFVGGGAFVVDFFTYCLLEWVGIHYLLAAIGAFIVGFAFNFTVSRILIFCADGKQKVSRGEVISVLVISCIGLALTEFLLFAGVHWLNMDYRISKIVASILVLFWNYVARKVFVYR